MEPGAQAFGGTDKAWIMEILQFRLVLILSLTIFGKPFDQFARTETCMQTYSCISSQSGTFGKRHAPYARTSSGS
jgi:hypothetical protein